MDQLSRKLAVILHADVVGSTTLVQNNETLAHKRIQAVFKQFSDTIGCYGGNAREIRGDALVAEFHRASDAVTAAIAFQAQNEISNSTFDDDIRPALRIGISLGEVVAADNTVTGAGVVLAQRLEQLAEPGGVVVQGSVSETVPIRLPFKFSNLGEQMLKGFDQPVRAFNATLLPGEKLPAPEEMLTGEISAAGDSLDPVTPSIAVLPFTNMSNDPEQDFFSDGITEDIITALSSVSSLLVIARNSTFVYKGTSVDVRQVGADLGVRHVLEGSVRKSGRRVRITAQLIDTGSGDHLWAERYDRELEDVFEVQDEITQMIVSELDVRLLGGEQARFWSGGTRNLRAWEYLRKGRDILSQYQADTLQEGKRLIEKAVELDPDYAEAWAALAASYFHLEEDARYSDEQRQQALKLSREYAKKALECDPLCTTAFAIFGIYYLHLRNYDDALENVSKAVELAPNHANNLAISAVILNKSGHPEKALQRLRKAMRLCPVYPAWYPKILGQIYRVMGDADKAIESFMELTDRDPDSLEGHISLAEIFIQADRLDEAKASAAKVIQLNPEFSTKEYLSHLSYRDHSQISRYQKNLKKAGLPE